MILIKIILCILCSFITGFLIYYIGIKMGFLLSKSNFVFFGSVCGAVILMVAFMVFYIWLFGLWVFLILFLLIGLIIAIIDRDKNE